MSETETTNAQVIRAVDSEGREVMVPREQWAGEVLPAMLQRVWDKPEDLYRVIAGSLNEGFVVEITDAAAHLYAIDTNPVRGVCVWSQVLLLRERLVEAELVLARYTDAHGENPFVLAAAAKVYAVKGEEARAQVSLDRANAHAAEMQPQAAIVRMVGPIWLPPGSPAGAIFGTKSPQAATVTFLGGTVEAPLPGEDAPEQLPEPMAVITRTLPLYLAEQVEMRTGAQAHTAVPWLPRLGYLVNREPWPAEFAVAAGRVPEEAGGYVVTVHVDAEVEPWEATLRFLRTEDGVQIGELSAEFSPGDPRAGLAELADKVVDLLEALGAAETPADYAVPADFDGYMLALGQLLALRCQQMDPAWQGMAGKGEALSACFVVCESSRGNVPARLLLIEMMGAMQQLEPEIATEFRERLGALMDADPMPRVDAAFGGKPA